MNRQPNERVTLRRCDLGSDLRERPCHIAPRCSMPAACNEAAHLCECEAVEYVRDEDQSGSPCLCRFDGDGILVGDPCLHHRTMEEAARGYDRYAG